jgi:hypothetical protein
MWCDVRESLSLWPCLSARSLSGPSSINQVSVLCLLVTKTKPLLCYRCVSSKQIKAFVQAAVEGCNTCAQSGSDEMAAFGFSLDLKGVGVLLCLGKGQDDPNDPNSGPCDFPQPCGEVSIQ